MKRQLLITSIVAFLVLTLGIACELGSRRVSDVYQQRMAAIGAQLGNGSWNEALMLTLDTAVHWARDCGIIQLWVNHADTDQVTQSLMQLRAAILCQDELSVLQAFDACMENFGHLHHRDAFTLKNIL